MDIVDIDVLSVESYTRVLLCLEVWKVAWGCHWIICVVLTSTFSSSCVLTASNVFT